MTEFIIKNVRDHAVPVGNVSLAKDEQLTCHVMTPEIEAAHKAGDISITNADLSAAERKELAEDFTPNFHTGDPAIDGTG